MVQIMSIRIRLVLCADFREIVGKRQIVEEINANSTLKHVLDMLAKKYRKEFEQVVDPRTGIISLEFLVSINGRVIRDTNVKLNNDDILMITIPTGGG